MRIEFEGIEIQDFKSIQLQHVTFDMGQGVHFMRGSNQGEPRLGSNGSGKTTMWDAVCWCIYGRTPDGLRNTDVVPWDRVPWAKEKFKPKVVLHFTADGKRNDLLRSTTPNKLKLNGKDVGQQEVEALFGLSFELFINTILLAQGQPLFFDKPPREKMELFTQVLELDKWDARSKLASDKVNELEKESIRLEGQLAGVQSNLDQVRTMYKSVRSQATEWDEDRETKLVEYKKQMKELTKTLETMEGKLHPAEVAYDGAMLEVKALRSKRPDIEAKLNKARAARDKVYLKAEQWEQEVEKIEAELRDLAKAKTCPTCGQTITKDDLETHKQELRDRKNFLKKKIDAGPPREVISEYVDHQTAYDISVAYEREFDTKAEEAREVIDRYAPDVAQCTAKISSLQKSIDQLETEDSPYQDQLFKLKRNRTKLKKQVEDLEDSIGTIHQSRESYKFWVRGFKDIRLYVIEEVLQDLELTTQALLDDVGLLDWQVKYAVEKETKSGTVKRGISVSILSPYNSEAVKWENWSGGEGQRLRLVGALALSEVLLNYAGVQSNLDVLDEPTQRLSVEGVRDLCDFLADRASRLERMTFFIDHMSVESARFSSVITVVKDEDGTRIET